MTIVNLTRFLIKEKEFNQIVAQIFHHLKLTRKDINIFLISEKRIREINYKFRGIKKPTDVLSFAEKETKENFIYPIETNREFLGEIYICPIWIKKQIQGEKIDFYEELIRVLVHGILHLLGYQHKGVSEKESKKMIELQEKIVNKLNHTNFASQ